LSNPRNNTDISFKEPLPEPTGAQLAQEAQQEAAVFSQAANVDKLLTLLREFDGGKDNLADNEDIQVSTSYWLVAEV
jgi:signal transducing adaptor molecule